MTELAGLMDSAQPAVNGAVDTGSARINRLKATALDMRRAIVDMIYHARSGHPGSSLSAADIMTALYFDVLNIDPAHPSWNDRDRFVMSKGHGCPAWYAALALRGFFPVELLRTLRRFESILQGHPVKKTPGIDMSTGSLGQGLSFGAGMALEAKLTGGAYHVFVLLGDGELNEGQVWEAAALASRFRLDNLTAIVDNNRLQMDGFSRDVMPMEPIDAKFAAFGWNVVRIDGHDMGRIVDALESAKHAAGAPVCVVADTVKGKGVSYMENVRAWHGDVPDERQYEAAMREFDGVAV